MFSCRRNDAEDKPRQKEGRDRRSVTVSFCTRIIVSVLVCTICTSVSLVSLLKLEAFFQSEGTTIYVQIFEVRNFRGFSS